MAWLVKEFVRSAYGGKAPVLVVMLMELVGRYDGGVCTRKRWVLGRTVRHHV